MKKLIFTILSCLLMTAVFAQVPKRKKSISLGETTPGQPTQTDAQGGTKLSGPRKDSLGFEHRNPLDDSITVSYRYLDSVKRYNIDSSVNDFDRYYPVPSSYQYLGNNGAAAFSLIYQPFVKTGFDPGFHAFDIYKYSLETTKFYKTSRPFSMLSYQLASGKEQMLKAGHTQSPRQNINIGFDYRLISAPGFFITQNNNHNAYRLFGSYQGKKKRYSGYVVLNGNTIRASQNGGIQNDSALLDPNRKDRFSVPVNMGSSAEFRQSPFLTTVLTGNTYKDFTFFLRQSYDLGKRDSVAINDSTMEFIFYPKLRLQYSFTSLNSRYRFSDVAADSILYKSWYDVTLRDSIDTFFIQDKWRIVTNDFSILQFPDTKNSSQFFLAGATLQNIAGQLKRDTLSFYNLLLHGEYRNRTRNRKWDVLLKGEYYVSGFNNGDYSAYARLERVFNNRFGNVSLFFNNVSRSPSFVFDKRSSFYLDSKDNDFKKENIVSFGGEAANSFITLGVRNHLMTNLCYYKSYNEPAQYSKLVNLLQVYASKKIKVYRRWNLYEDIVIQQTDAASPVRVPVVFTRSRLAYEGRFFKNLNLSTGIEARYYTAYKANNFSPVIGQFSVQDTMTVKNLPDITAFLHFRIRGFTGFLRIENLNTVSFDGGFGFLNNNFAAPHYPTQGFLFRFGIQWWFVN